MECISGLKSEDVIGKPAFEIFPFLVETGEDKYFHETLAGNEAFHGIVVSLYRRPASRAFLKDTTIRSTTTMALSSAGFA